MNVWLGGVEGGLVTLSRLWSLGRVPAAGDVALVPSTSAAIVPDGAMVAWDGVTVTIASTATLRIGSGATLRLGFLEVDTDGSVSLQDGTSLSAAGAAVANHSAVTGPTSSTLQILNGAAVIFTGAVQSFLGTLAVTGSDVVLMDSLSSSPSAAWSAGASNPGSTPLRCAVLVESGGGIRGSAISIANKCVGAHCASRGQGAAVVVARGDLNFISSKCPVFFSCR